jgi:hypothetical protein
MARRESAYHEGVGGLSPVAMDGTLKLLQEEASIVGRVEAPCDAAGSPSG